MQTPVVVKVVDDPHRDELGWATIITEPDAPRVFVNLSALKSQYSACGCIDFCNKDFDEFVEQFAETVEHEFAHIVGWTCNEKVTRRFEKAGAWARGWSA